MRTRPSLGTIGLTAILAWAVAAGAAAGQPCPVGRCPTPAYTSPPVAYAARPAGADPTGFVTWLNFARAGHRLPPLAYDPGLTAYAVANNHAQRARGLGHHVNPRAWQCAGVGRPFATAGGALASWMNSPAHRAILMHPSLRTIGVALGDQATANLR